MHFLAVISPYLFFIDWDKSSAETLTVSVIAHNWTEFDECQDSVVIVDEKDEREHNSKWNSH